MADLRIKYSNLLKVMREAYSNDDGSTLEFNSEEFCGRMIGLCHLFMQYGVTGKEDFDEILGDDWTWDHYLKVINQLQALGAVDEYGIGISPVLEQVANEMSMLCEGNYHSS